MNSLLQAHLQPESTKVKPEPDNESSSQLKLASPTTPASEWDALREKLREQPHDTDLWNRLVDRAEESGDIDKIKQAYEAVLEKYPNTSSVQIAYLNHFLTNPTTFPYAESLFARFLRTSPSVDLWKFYIVYVRRVNSGPATRDIVRKAYEFALSHVGQDKDSGEIWSDYIAFLKSGEASTTWEEQQKMDALRKVYHRAVQIPLENVEVLWKELDAFEMGLNKITAKKFLQDLTPSHMTARTNLRELRKHLAPLFPPPPASNSTRPLLQLSKKPTFSNAERALVGSWRAYLKWEESNPLEIEDKGVLNARLQGVYRKAVVKMRFYPEIWYLAYIWTNGAGKQEEALGILKAGIEANPSSFLLNFAYAEHQESAKNNAEVHATYEKLVRVLSEELERIEAREAAANASFSSDNTDPSTSSKTEDNANANGKDTSIAQNGEAKDKEKEKEKPKSKELIDRKQEFGLVYIMYIRFALRTEGVDASRAAFLKARKEKWTPWEVFEAAALMEYHVAKRLDIASKVFILAHQRFPDEIDFVMRYLGFLMSVNDENNARALFERAVTNFTPDKARPLWDRWARYEYQYGSLEAAQKLEKRMSEIYPNDMTIKRFAQRHTYLNIDAIANRDLGLAMLNNSRNLGIGRTETLSFNSNSQPSSGMQSSQSQIIGGSGLAKRPPSPERSRRGDDQQRSGDYGPPHKKSRPMSPPPPPLRDRDRDRDRDRWEPPPPKGRRYGSPMYDRDRERERDRSPIRRPEKEREEPEKPPIPQVLSWFLGTLQPPTSFDGPKFRVDDLMQVFRNAVIPGNPRPRSPPPPPRNGMYLSEHLIRPPPDYGPYQGPSGRGGRRY
ncbi:Suf-domain-containing protein [Rickenella mellea]|uniref:mRNA 3'-end-processing protein RNA14 n=1 Tax=Rickenella mellea TaxID=50990 RepID=A0A4Y7PRH5_9AGAM|nr:Suf-domain-containing protein [Rickenella mellea]